MTTVGVAPCEKCWRPKVDIDPKVAIDLYQEELAVWLVPFNLIHANLPWIGTAKSRNWGLNIVRKMAVSVLNPERKMANSVLTTNGRLRIKSHTQYQEELAVWLVPFSHRPWHSIHEGRRGRWGTPTMALRLRIQHPEYTGHPNTPYSSWSSPCGWSPSTSPTPIFPGLVPGKVEIES